MNSDTEDGIVWRNVQWDNELRQREEWHVAKSRALDKRVRSEPTLREMYQCEDESTEGDKTIY